LQINQLYFRITQALPLAVVFQLISRKLIQGIVMIFIVSILTFVLLASAGGDALTALRENPQISEETIEALRKTYGLDRPLYERYAGWLRNAASGDMGESLSFRAPVLGLVLRRLLNSFYLASTALFFALGLAFSLSLLSAMLRSAPLRVLIETIVLTSVSMPRILLSLLVLVLMAFTAGTSLQFGRDSFGLFLLTAAAFGIPLSGIFLAQIHSALEATMREDFVQLARAKGLSEWSVIFVHALRPSLNPVITLFGLSIGAMLGGSVIVESVLGWPGIGSLMVGAVRSRDVPLVMGIVLVSSVTVWFGNFLAELLQAINDVRIRAGNSA
jgi:peptide/nickel transport system permease protein